MIVYKISRMLVPERYEVKMILSAGTYLTEQFNRNMKDNIKGKGNQWVAPHFKNYKLVIPENHSFFSLKLFLCRSGNKTNFSIR